MKDAPEIQDATRQRLRDWVNGAYRPRPITGTRLPVLPPETWEVELLLDTLETTEASKLPSKSQEIEVPERVSTEWKRFLRIGRVTFATAVAKNKDPYWWGYDSTNGLRNGLLCGLTCTEMHAKNKAGEPESYQAHALYLGRYAIGLICDKSHNSATTHYYELVPKIKWGETES